MNRIFIAVALQSAIAAVVIATAPAASAADDLSNLRARDETQLYVGADRFVSTADRGQVSAQARAAASSRQVRRDEVQLYADADRLESTVSRAQVVAAARKAVRLGLTGG